MFYQNKKVQDVYYITKNFTNSGTCYENSIEICNNEQFVLNLEKVKFGSSYVTNAELNKFSIDWGDGTKETFGRTINVSALGKMKNSQQKIIFHTFNADSSKKYKIVIKLFNTIGDVYIINIPYTIINKSLYELGANFELLQANNSNRNLTQFVMKENVNNSIIIVSEKDWMEL